MNQNNLPYNQFSVKYNKLFLENIIQFKKSLLVDIKENDYFVDFYPSFGITKNEKCDFLIYGQATNGWRTGFYLKEDINDEKIHHCIKESNKYLSQKKHTPIDWVNILWTDSIYKENMVDNLSKKFYDNTTYRTHKSFFWNVTYKIICDYYNIERQSWNWTRKLVWSNLYKISSENANPNKYQQNAQFKISWKLVKKELDELKPKFCIVLTNKEWWEPFSNHLNTNSLSYDFTLTEIVSYEEYKNTKIIVTTRPRFGNGEVHVSQLLKLMQQV